MFCLLNVPEQLLCVNIFMIYDLFFIFQQPRITINELFDLIPVS